VKVATYNVNGIRAAVKNGLLDWLKTKDIDVLCLQEIKVAKEDFDSSPFEQLGYECFIFPAQKKGYSGVGIFTKIKPNNIHYGIGYEDYDNEGRNIMLDFDDVSIMSAYFPSGTTGDIRQDVKMNYLDKAFDVLTQLKSEKKNFLVCGDFNICHRAIDIHDPVRNKDVSGFKPEERAWMTKFFESGFIDTFRLYNPQPNEYSWWSYRAGARKNNKGWRIDYIAASENLNSKIVSSAMFQDAVHSDHCPVFCEIIV
jgi:exodeoxyribonuclease-3